MGRTLKRGCTKMIDTLYPKRCAICDDALNIGEEGVCDKCRERIVYISDPICLTCGRPITDNGGICDECVNTRHVFKAGRSVFSYDFIAESIYRFKYLNRTEYAAFFGAETVKAQGEFLAQIKPDAIIPVPLHKKRMLKRGYNQAALLAHEMSKLTGIPVYEDCLKRSKDTVPQKKFNKKQRFINMKKAFIVGKNVVKLSKVVVVDDIFTTGSTIDSLSLELKKAGVKDIYFITLTSAGT